VRRPRGRHRAVMLPKTLLKLILGTLLVPAVLSVELVAADTGAPSAAAQHLKARVVDPCTGTPGGPLVERLAVNADGSVGAIAAPACR
jgi:hypothetical protein